MQHGLLVCAIVINLGIAHPIKPADELGSFAIAPFQLTDTLIASKFMNSISS